MFQRCRVVVGVTVDDDVHESPAERGDPLTFLARSGAGQVYARVDACRGAREGHALRMVAGARTGDPSRPFFPGQLRDAPTTPLMRTAASSTSCAVMAMTQAWQFYRA